MSMTDLSNVSIGDLLTELYSRDCVVATKIWFVEDLEKALIEHGVDPNKENVQTLKDMVQDGLEDCSSDAEYISSEIDWNKEHLQFTI